MKFNIGDEVVYKNNNPGNKDLLKRPVGIVLRRDFYFPDKAVYCEWTLKDGHKFEDNVYETNIKLFIKNK